MVVSRSSSSQVEGLDKVILYPPTYSFLAKKFYQRLIDKEHSIGRLGGIKASMRVPAITHVMYTDDVMLFSKANLREAEILNECLETYCNWSGQQINKQKSRLIFWKATQPSIARNLKRLLQMKILPKDVCYLGSSFNLCRSKTKDFKFLQNRIEAKLLGWRSKCLSWPGRGTMIKSGSGNPYIHYVNLWSSKNTLWQDWFSHKKVLVETLIVKWKILSLESMG